MSNSFRIRRATVDDAEIIASHRARMFQDMGDVEGEAFETLREKSCIRLKEWFAAGDYVGWLAVCVEQPTRVVGGAGIQLQLILLRPSASSGVTEGRQGIIVNVFTEPEWRRRGIGSLLMKETIAFARTEGVDRLLLHASKEGRSIYEALGFVDGNEMRFIFKP